MDSVYMTVASLLGRHFITWASGTLLSHGIIQQSQVEAFSAACLLFAGISMSFWNKYGRIIMEAHNAKKAAATGAALAALVCLCPLAGGSPAYAADMPAKARAQVKTLGLTYDGAGWYWGVNTFAEIDSASQSGLVNSNLMTAGAAVGVTVGFQKGNGTTFWAVELMGNYHNIGSNSNVIGQSVMTNWSLEQRVKLGGPIAALLNFLPSSGLGAFPSLPNMGAPSGSTHPYLMIGVREVQEEGCIVGVCNTVWRVKGAIGAGMMQQFSSGVTADIWAEWNPKQQGFTIGGPQTANTGQGFRIGAALLY